MANRNLTDLLSACDALYDAGLWSCDRTCDESKLWDDLRDALGRPSGTSPDPVSVDEPTRDDTSSDPHTKEERIISDHTIDLWHTTLNIDDLHPNDQRIICDSVSNIQRCMAMRVMRREYPECYPYPNPSDG